MVFYFHLTEGTQVIPDLEGADLPDFTAAQALALRSIAELVAEAVVRGERDYRGTIQVEDGQGAEVLTFAFACPIQIMASVRSEPA